MSSQTRQSPEAVTPLGTIPKVTLAERLREAEAVVSGRVVKRAGVRIFDMKPTLGNEPLPRSMSTIPAAFTEYDIALTEVFKTHPFAGAAGTVIRIASHGGIGEFSGRTIADETGVPELKEGSSYILLLRFGKVQNEMLFGEFDVFDITDARVSTGQRLRSSQHGKELDGVATQQAIKTVRIILNEQQ